VNSGAGGPGGNGGNAGNGGRVGTFQRVIARLLLNTKHLGR
jgi:hypothetical protein